MSITLSYFAQARVAAGHDDEQFDAAEVETVGALVRAACQRHGDPLSQLLLTENGTLAAWILVSVNGAAVHGGDNTAVNDGDIVRLLSPISGG